MKLKLIAAALGTAFLAAGCAVKPVAIDDAAHRQRAAEDQRRLFDDQENLASPLTLADAVGRAVKYNMEYRTRLMEEAAAMGQTDLASFDLLPKLTAAAGYTTRSNEAFGYGFTPAGTISTTPSAAVERTRDTNSVTFAWNVLDFGLSYVRAKQLADQSLIAEERRRKALQNLTQDVRLAWWRAAAAQSLLPEIDTLLAEVDQAANRARLIETRKLLPPLQIVAYRRSLLDLEQQISARRQDLSQAKLELAQLLNLKPGQEYALAAPSEDIPPPPELATRIEALEALAVSNRPELREEGYRARITDLEGQKQLLSILPSLGLDVGTNYDSNRYLVNNRWASAGMNVSFNLLKAFSLPAIQRSNEAAARVDESRRLALTAAVLAQTRIAAVRYQFMTHEYGIWDEAVQDDTRIVGYLNAAKQVGIETELELIRAKARALISKINRNLVYANVQGALGRIYNSIGVDSLPLETESQSGAALSKLMEERLEAWEQANFTGKPAPVHASIAVPTVAGLGKEAAASYTSALQRILRLSKVNVASQGANAPYRLDTAVNLQPAGVSGQPVSMKIRVMDGAGAVISEAEQTSMLVPPVGPDQWQALGEGAGYKMVAPLRALLAKPGQRAETAAAAPAAPVIDPASVASSAKLLATADEIRLQLSTTLRQATERGAEIQ